MSQFILPVTIQERKIVLLDLQPFQPQPSDQRKIAVPDFSISDDVYVVEIPTAIVRKNKIIGLPLERVIQSLHTDHKDIQIKDIKVGSEFNPDSRILTIRITQRDDVEFQKPHGIQEGLDIILDKDEKEIYLGLHRMPGFNPDTNTSIVIRFLLEFEDDPYEYDRFIQLFLASRSQITFAGLDFGSEASQMSKARFVNENDLNETTIPLFKLIKKNEKGTAEDQAYSQFDPSGYYKSEFFASETLKPINDSNLAILEVRDFSSELAILTETIKLGKGEFADMKQIPNLKIIHGNPEYAKKITFTIAEAGNARINNLSELKNSLYFSLLKKMLDAYMVQDRPETPFLHFTVLVPNIYSVQEIIKLKKLIRIILKGADREGKLKGIEISSLSESDAAFIGYGTNITTDAYFIVIDSGKGTTDFSVIQTDKEDPALIRSVYRNGFAGAGNLITYAFCQSMLAFLRSQHPNDSVLQTNLSKFLEKSSDTFFLLVHRLIENWKQNYKPGVRKDIIEREWSSAVTGTFDLEGLFTQSSPPTVGELIALLDNIQRCHDWEGYVEETIRDLSLRIRKGLKEITSKMSKLGKKCGGILLTGRAFKFQPYYDNVIESLRGLPGLRNALILNNDKTDLKGICMKGIFTRTAVTISDVSATPLEQNKENAFQMKRFDLLPNNIFGSIEKFWLKLLSGDKAHFYDDSTNTLTVLARDLRNCHFFASGRTYETQLKVKKENVNCKLVLCRDGMYLVLPKTGGKREIIELYPRLLAARLDEESIEKSLFPNVIPTNLLNS